MDPILKLIKPGAPLPPAFYRLTALEAAPRLLGQTLVRRTEEGDIRCRIVETESYGGIHDKGSHAYGGRRTARTDIMFGPGGTAYVYLIYGMYNCLNVVTGTEGDPQAVLIRAVEPLSPADEAAMRRYRGTAARKPADLSGRSRQAVPRAGHQQSAERLAARSARRTALARRRVNVGGIGSR